jgi:hypothetical protein
MADKPGDPKLMPSDTATAIAYVGAFVGLVGGGVALFNAWKAVRWKRAELANSYLKDLNTNEELVFACRALDWNGGRLVVPANLRPLLSDKADSIIHDYSVMAYAMRPDLLVSEMERDSRIQLYRTAMDALLSWLGLVASALDRDLFIADDVDVVGYWVFHIERVGFLDGFIRAFGYDKQTQKLRKAFQHRANAYNFNWDGQATSSGPDGSVAASRPGSMGTGG